MEFATAAVRHVRDGSTWGPIFASTAEKGQHVLDAAHRAGHDVVRVYGYNTTPDHNNRKCVDFMHYGNTTLRKWLESYLIKHADDLGVEGLISNRRCIGFPSEEDDHPTPYWNGPDGKWRPYSGPNPHTDHVHVQFNTDPIGQPKVPRHTLYVIKACPAYDTHGRKAGTARKGTKLYGVFDDHHFNDGRYLRVGQKPDRRWYPADHLSPHRP